MSQRVKSQLPTFRRLRRMSVEGRKAFLRQCDSNFMDCIFECVLNLLKGCLPCNRRQLNKLRRWRNSLHALSLKKTSLKTRKRLLLQKGGLLGALLTPIVSFFGGLVSNAFTR